MSDVSYPFDPSEVLSLQSSEGSVRAPFLGIQEEASPILEGTVFFEGYPAMASFDTTSSHSFVSEGFLAALGKESHATGERLVIHTPAGAFVSPNRTTEGIVTLTTANRIMSFNVPLQVMVTRDYELVLGADWMRASRAMIDMEDRAISVWTEDAGRDWFYVRLN